MALNRIARTLRILHLDPKRVVRPLRNRSFALIWTGQAISGLGNPLQTIALAFAVIDAKGGDLAVSLVFVSSGIPRIILSFISGGFVDKMSAIVVMRACDLGRTGTSLLLALLLMWHAPLVLLYTVLGVGGALTGAFTTAFNALAPTLVDRSELNSANALFGSIPQLAMVLGAGLGGVLTAAVGGSAALAINAGTFATAWVLETQGARLGSMLLRRPHHAGDGAREAAKRIVAEVEVGVAEIRQLAGLGTLLAVDAVVTFATAGPLSVGLPLLAANRGGPLELGLLMGSFGAGALGGSLAAGSMRGRDWNSAQNVLLLQLMQGPLLALMVIHSEVSWVLILFVVGLINSFAVVAFLGLVHSRVPTARIGRVMAVITMSGLVLQPVAQVVTGAVGSAEGESIPFLIGGILVALSAACGLLSPRCRMLSIRV